eukprot:4970235-Prymnesium_polylepis.1
MTDRWSERVSYSGRRFRMGFERVSAILSGPGGPDDLNFCLDFRKLSRRRDGWLGGKDFGWIKSRTGNPG